MMGWAAGCEHIAAISLFGCGESAMSAKPAQRTSAAPSPDPAEAEKQVGGARAPLAFVVDGDASIRHFLSLVLHGVGIDTEEFADAPTFRAALSRRAPDLVFLNIALESAEAIECVVTLSKASYAGYVQLMSNRGSAVLEHVKSIGQQQHLQMLAPLKKPFDTAVLLKLLQDLKLGHQPSLAARLDLDEALRNGWIEFWYQPKIDLRRKQLVGTEAFARARHPRNGVLTPDTFMPGATESSLIALSEQALAHGLKANVSFAKLLGVNLRLAVNIPLNVLSKIDVGGIVQAYRDQFEKWPGLTIDVSEDQIITDMAQATEICKRLRPHSVHLAIDHCGRGYSALARLKEVPFAELKLDRAFVTDCGTDKVNAPLCKTVIDLAHNFGCVAVGIGIEKASEALALVSMGCDYGQGFLLGQPMPEDRFASLLRQRAASQGRQATAEREASGQAS
jgi:EAL domain-containing protein (putative c-di-GMP-specific phosphodiesterase class I)/FixJ family two-component response regulator